MRRRRRTPGEGSVYQRSRDGRWVAALPGGRKEFTGKTRSEAVAKRAAWTPPAPAAPAGIPLGAWLDDWIGRQGDHLRDSSLVAYRNRARLLDGAALRDVPLGRLTPRDVQAALDTLALHHSAASVAHLRGLLRAALADAQRSGELLTNPVTPTRPPARTPRAARAFSPDEAARFLAALDGEPHAAFFLTLLCLGLRRGEALALEVRDVDLDAGTIAIRGSRNGWGRDTAGPTKSAAGRRTLRLPELLAGPLRAAIGGRTEGCVFLGEKGGPLGSTVARKHYKRILATAGLDDARIHDLRHTVATWLLEEQPAHVVGGLLGHANPTVTLAVYAHVLRRRQDDASVRMGERLRETVHETVPGGEKPSGRRG